MSKSEKQKIDSQDKTNPYTGLGNASTFQRKSSQSRSTASNNSMGNGFDISAQNLMPVILKISQQNQTLKADRDNLKKQMNTLDRLSQNILSQNQALRLHYAQRSTDVQMLIKSFTINTNENLSDSRHLVHCYRQNNIIISKQIQQATSKISHIDQVTSKMSHSLDRLTAENAQEENNVRNRMVKNKLIENNMRKLERIRDQNVLGQLQKQVCDLQLSINALKKKNILTINFIKMEKNSIQTDKPIFKDLALQTIKSTKKLQSALGQLGLDYQKFCGQNQELVQNIQSQYKSLQQLYTVSENKRLILNRLKQRKKQIQNSHTETKNKTEILTSEKAKLVLEKNKLQKQIQDKKKNISNLQAQHQKNKQGIQQQKAKNISQIKQKIKKAEFDLIRSLQKQLNPEKIQSDSMLAHLKQELQSTDKEVIKMKQKISQLNNPTKQIIKLEMHLKNLKTQKKVK